MPVMQTVGTALGPTKPIVLDTAISPFNLTLTGLLDGGSTLTWKAEFTTDPLTNATDALGAGLTWVDHATLVALTAGGVGNIAFPVRAVRGNITAFTSGRLVLTATQAGRP